MQRKNEIMDLLEKAFLDDSVLSCDRDNTIMRILQYHYQDQMTEKRKNSGCCIEAKFLNSDGSIKEEEYKKELQDRGIEYKGQQKKRRIY